MIDLRLNGWVVEVCGVWPVLIKSNVGTAAILKRRCGVGDELMINVAAEPSGTQK